MAHSPGYQQGYIWCIMPRPEVSVIVPCHNVAPFIERCVGSVIEQKGTTWELICVDDGSTDDTLPRLKALRAKAPPGMTVLHQPNRGACAARNTGLGHAQGEYLQFLDADDVLLPGKLAHQLDLVQRSGGPDLVIGSSRTIGEDGRAVSTDRQEGRDPDPFLELMRHGLNVTSAILWRHDAVVRSGGWDESLGSSQEYDLMFRMLKNGARVLHDREVLTEIHERRHGRISRTNQDRNWVRFVELRARVLDHLKATRPGTDLQPHLQVLFDSIRNLYHHAPAQAVELYRKLIPGDFVPGPSTATGRGYLLLHRMFGFSLANQVRSLTGRLRPFSW